MALFRLAEKLGCLDPYAMGEQLPAALLHEWVAFWRARAELEKQAVDSAIPK
jgi:hypothetical protein